MDADNRHIWRVWVQSLHRWGVQDVVAALLEGLGPLTVLGAQAIYISQPLLNHAVPQGHLEVLASLLEEPDETKAFIDSLREAN